MPLGASDGDAHQGDGALTLAVVMFTDIVSSTELLVRKGQAVADDVRRVNVRISADCVARHGGTVVKRMGDGVMSVFGSATAAIGAAIEIHQLADRWGRGSGRAAFQLRIGIAAGDVVCEDGDYFGLAVVEANRLESTAAPGAIRTTRGVTALARIGDDAVTRVGMERLKGLDDPVDVVEIRWVGLPDEDQRVAAHLPPVVGSGGGMPFAGRADTLASLRDAWRAATETSTGVVVVAGEPGVGKTRTVSEFVRELDAAGARVLAGRCDEHHRVPFRPLAEALAWYADHASGDDVATGLGRYPGELSRLHPGLRERVIDLPEPLDADDATTRLRLLQACESWLVGAGPTVLVVDDVQWSDPDTVLVLRHLASVSVPGLLVVCTVRDTDLRRDHPVWSMLADFRRLANVSHVALRGLDLAEVREFVTRAGGQRLDDAATAFADRLASRTAGNPFFLGELLRHFTEDGVLVRRDGLWVADRALADAPVPDGARDVVHRRVDRLPVAAQGVLSGAAVLGLDFEVPLLSMVLDEPELSLLDALDAAVAANLVEEVGADRFRFAHGLVRDTLYAGLSDSRRARVHRAAARAIEARQGGDIGPVAVELATHWTAAGVEDGRIRAVESAFAAAEYSLTRQAVESALGWYRTAVDLAADDPLLARTRRRALAGLAIAERFSGKREFNDTANRAAREAIDAGDPEVARRALRVWGRFGFSVVQDAAPEKLALLEEALASLEFQPAHRAELLGLLATELVFTGDMDARRRRLAEIADLLPALSPLDQAVVLSNSAVWHFRRCDRAEFRRRVDILLAGLGSEERLQRPRDERGWEVEATYFLCYWHTYLGDRDATDATLARLRELADGSVDPTLRWWSQVTAAFVASMDGSIDDLDRLTGEFTATMQEAGSPEAAAWGGLGLFASAREHDQLPRLLPGWSAFAAGSNPAGPAVAGLGYLHLAAGNHDEARDILSSVRACDIPEDGALTYTMSMFCEVAAAVGTPEQCQDLTEHFWDWRTMTLACGPVFLGAVDRHLARLHDRCGDHARADELFASALRTHEDLRSVPWVARTRLDWAESLRNRGDHAAVGAQIEAAGRAIGELPLRESRRRLADLAS